MLRDVMKRGASISFQNMQKRDEGEINPPTHPYVRNGVCTVHGGK